jgi:DNA helicase HerA-like ATPase
MEEWNIVLGVRDGPGEETPVVLSPRDRRHHLYAIGKSGTGKTTFLQNLIFQDICAGHGVGVIDPHGDLASDLLNYDKKHLVHVGKFASFFADIHDFGADKLEKQMDKLESTS